VRPVARSIKSCIGKIEGGSNAIYHGNHIAGGPQGCKNAEPCRAADFSEKTIAIFFFDLDQIIPVVCSLCFLINFSGLKFFPQPIRRKGTCEYLQVGMDDGTARSRHVIPAHQVINRFGMFHFVQVAEVFQRQTKSVGNLPLVQSQSWGYSDDCPSGHGTQPVIRGDVGE
jgi:hypothetical protein